jgi:hypothetical protein
MCTAVDNNNNNTNSKQEREEDSVIASGGSMRNFPLDTARIMFFEENEGTTFIVGGGAANGLDGSIVLEIRNWFMAILFLWLCRQVVRISLHGTYWQTNSND